MAEGQFFLQTAHGTFLASDENASLIHIPATNNDDPRLIKVGYSGTIRLPDSSPLSAYALKANYNGYSFSGHGLYLCAAPGHLHVEAARPEAKAWETFYLRADCIRDEDRFRRVVHARMANRQPVLVHCGTGPRILPGFLNVDRFRYNVTTTGVNSDEIFTFPFADGAWNIPDHSVDYIYHEDFIEHIPQLQQIQFLAETFRVLKPGSFHRVNTPDLIEAMKVHSHFQQGFDGVYTGEMQWGHVALFSQMALKEIAEMVGYSHVVFTTRSHGISPFAVEDTRPWTDRDAILGNIYADLRK
jgi:predicted SAM-dependent methyltransferase